MSVYHTHCNSIHNDSMPFFHHIACKRWMLFVIPVQKSKIWVQSFCFNFSIQFIHDNRIAQANHGIKLIHGRSSAASMKLEFWFYQHRQPLKICFCPLSFISHNFRNIQALSYFSPTDVYHFQLFFHRYFFAFFITAEHHHLVFQLGTDNLFRKFQCKI